LKISFYIIQPKLRRQRSFIVTETGHSNHVRPHDRPVDLVCVPDGPETADIRRADDPGSYPSIPDLPVALPGESVNTVSKTTWDTVYHIIMFFHDLLFDIQMIWP